MKENKFMDSSAGINPLGPSNKVKAAVRKAIKKINNGSDREMERLRSLFEDKFRISSERLLFANSLKELLYLIPDVLKPKRALIIGPALKIYEDAAQSVGAEVISLNAMEADGFVFDISCMQKHLHDVDLVFLANPNRITGKIIPWEEVSNAIAAIPSGRPHFVIDESLIEFAYPATYHHNMIHEGNVTILRTTAYYYGMSGLELAYAISSPEVVHLYEEKKHWDVSLLSLEAARTAYKDSIYSKASKQYMFHEKKTLIGMLKKIDCARVYDTDTNVLLVKIEKNPDEVLETLRRAGLAAKDCGEIRGLDRTFIRISVMKHENNLKLISALNRLCQNR